MKTVTHSPRPWNVQRTITGKDFAVEMTGHNSEGEAKYSVFVESPEYVLAGVSGTGKAECLANAILIASAPDLLSALEYAKESLEVSRRYFPKDIKNPDTFQLENALSVVSEAITKSTASAD